MCRRDDYVVDEAAMERLAEIVEEAVTGKEHNFANGRFIRNLYENVVMSHARRTDGLDAPGIDDLRTLKAEDFCR